MSRARKPLSSQVRYRAGFQAAKVAAFTALSALCAVAAIGYGLDLGRSWGLLQAEGGVLKPLVERAALGGGVAVLGVAFFGGMVAYQRFYIVRLDVEDGGRIVRIVRLPPFPTLRLPAGRVHIGHKVHGNGVGAVGLVFPMLRRVKAPWLSVHVLGWRWPLLLDLNGNLEDGPNDSIRTARGE